MLFTIAQSGKQKKASVEKLKTNKSIAVIFLIIMFPLLFLLHLYNYHRFDRAYS